MADFETRPTAVDQAEINLAELDDAYRENPLLSRLCAAYCSLRLQLSATMVARQQPERHRIDSDWDEYDTMNRLCWDTEKASDLLKQFKTAVEELLPAPAGPESSPSRQAMRDISDSFRALEWAGPEKKLAAMFGRYDLPLSDYRSLADDCLGKRIAFKRSFYNLYQLIEQADCSPEALAMLERSLEQALGPVATT